MRQLKLFLELDTNHDSTLSLEELVAGAANIGLTKEDVEGVFYQIDADHNGKVDQEEFKKAFLSKRISFAKATPVEALYSLIFESRRETGLYRPKSATDINYPWGSYFNKCKFCVMALPCFRFISYIVYRRTSFIILVCPSLR